MAYDGEPPPPLLTRGITRDQLGLFALLVAILSFVLAVIPPAAPFAWILAVPALVAGILSLRRSKQSKHVSIAAIGMSSLALVISVVFAAGWFLGWFG